MIRLAGIVYFLESFVQNRWWRFQAVIVLTALSFFFAFPAYHYMSNAFSNENWEAVSQKIEHPLQQIQGVLPTSHAAKKTFRLTVPIIAKALNIGPGSVCIMQFALGIGLIYLLLLIAERITQDRLTALFFAGGAVFTYFGRACFVDIYSWFDGWAFFFLMAAVYFRNPWAVFYFCSLAAWTDERGFLAVTAVVVYHWIAQTSLGSSLKTLLSGGSLAGLIALAAYVFLRYILGKVFQLTTPIAPASMSLLFMQSEFWGIGIWTSLEGFWLLLIGAFISLIAFRRWLNGLAFLMITAGIMAVSLVVFDITRSASYLFALMPATLLVNSMYLEKDTLRRLTLVSAVVTFIFPAYYVQTDLEPYVLWFKPVVVRALKLTYEFLR